MGAQLGEPCRALVRCHDRARLVTIVAVALVVWLVALHALLFLLVILLWQFTP